MSSWLLAGVRAIVLEQGLGKARAKILSKQLESKGGSTEEQLSSASHILVGNSVRFIKILQYLKVKELPSHVLVLRADWLSACLVSGEKVDHSSYIVRPETSPKPSPSKPAASTLLLPSPTKQASPVTSPSQQQPHPSDQKQTPEPLSSPNKLNSPQQSTSATSSPQKLQSSFPVTNRRWKQSAKKTAWDNLDSDSDYVESEEEEGGGEREDEGEAGIRGGSSDEDKVCGASDGTELPPAAKRKRKWVCELASSQAQTWVNHNQHVTDKLQELLTVYENNGEKWRAMSTSKAIQAIKKHPKEITTLEEAQGVPFVGERIANKVYEIVSSGRLRRLEFVDHEKEAIIAKFKNIHGVGKVIAHQFYAQGYRTLDDLQKSGVLNRQQQIGLKYYDEFIERMPREEVAEIEVKVLEVCLTINEGLEVITCGSYRRGKLTCGDVDVLITHPDGRSHKGVFSTLISKCKAIGFITDDDLSVHDDPVGQCKYLGVCILPGEERKHRRLDVFVVPYSEFACALVHFTGSGHFNRSIRNKADKLGMSLSEHSLNTGVIRKNGVKIYNGTPVPVFSEEDIFKHLDVPYRDPTDRDWD